MLDKKATLSETEWVEDNTAPPVEPQWLKDDTATQTIEALLAEREVRYGSFEEFSRINFNLIKAIQDTPNWVNLSDHQWAALEMIVHKIARIMNGDPNYIDNWIDIAGYAQLEVDILKKYA